MLTRLHFRKDFRSAVRLLSDKPPKKDDKPAQTEHSSNPDDSKIYSDKINSLLKTMLENNKMKAETNFASAPIKPKRQKETVIKMEKIEENIASAAIDVAKAIGGDVKQTESELLSKVLGKMNQAPTDLSKLLSGMKVQHSEEDLQFETRGQQVKRLVGKSRSASGTRPLQRRPQHFRDQRSVSHVTTVNLLSGKPSGIFKKTDHLNYGPKLDTWELLENRELTLATAQPPSNYFQKMILWTEQGKVWKFPINNEQGLEEEENVDFTEHIFLDSQIEDWCPKKGPIRHFMELVCTGLSKNPFYTAQEKRDHIMWYKEYFESKKDVLTEVGVWDNLGGSNTESQSTQ